LAVPGHPFDARAAGCNLLIRDGATLVRGSSDVIEAIGGGLAPRPAHPPHPRTAHFQTGQTQTGQPRTAQPQTGQTQTGQTQTGQPKIGRPPLPGPVPERRPLADIAALHGQILSRLGPSPLAEDQLIRDLAMPPAHIAPELLMLELEGKIQRQAGGLLSRPD
ncbi:MAG: hypothetical protein U1D06_14095, partial [Paracoccaceae bacterium]|nr:hypothetical protein [Paracoccaceae bacterium]